MDPKFRPIMPRQYNNAAQFVGQHPALLQPTASRPVMPLPTTPENTLKMSEFPTLADLANRGPRDQVIVRDPLTFTFLDIPHRGATVRIVEIFSLHGIYEVIFAFQDRSLPSQTVFRMDVKLIPPVKLSFAIGDLLPDKVAYNDKFEIIARGGNGDVINVKNIWGVETGGRVVDKDAKPMGLRPV